jgi:enterochelin esterase-like enzyme
MRVDGLAVVLLAVAVTAGTAIVLAFVWDRTGGVRRAGVLAACVLSLLGTAALQLNRMTEAYPSWSALDGAGPEPLPARAATPAPDRLPGSQMLRLSVAGAASRLTLPMYVYLPPGYAQLPHLRYPVIEALHGYPGSPRTWIQRLDIRRHLDAEIAAGRMAPTVVLLPAQTPSQLLDTECTDLARGPKAETFLTVDVPAYAAAHLRIRTDRAGWGLTGYSAGGYCAINLGLRHPGRYAAAAALSGYADPGIAVGDGSEKTTNNDDWRLIHLPQPRLSLYLAWSDDDAPALRESLRLARHARSPLRVTTAVVRHGGHNDATWQEMEAPAFDWLSAHLARPLLIPAASPAAAPARPGRR